MTTLSDPLPADVEKAVQNLIDYGFASNKADAARKAILKVEEDSAADSLMRVARPKNGFQIPGGRENLRNNKVHPSPDAALLPHGHLSTRQ